MKTNFPKDIRTTQEESPESWYTGKTAWETGTPYLTPKAVKELSRIIPNDIEAVEFGAGGSTFWLSRRCSFVHSFETNPGWISRVVKRLEKEGIRNASVSPINRLKLFMPNKSIGLVLVDSDGSASDRVIISKQSLPWLKKGGIFVLDNYERYRLDFLDVEEWDIALFNEVHWDGLGTLIAVKQ